MGGLCDVHFAVVFPWAGKFLASEADFSGGWLNETEDRAAGRCLSTAALTHQTEGLPLFDEHVNVIDRLHVGHHSP